MLTQSCPGALREATWPGSESDAAAFVAKAMGVKRLDLAIHLLFCHLSGGRAQATGQALSPGAPKHVNNDLALQDINQSSVVSHSHAGFI